MTYTIINPDGNFNCWKETHLCEIKAKKFSNSIGKLLYENKDIIVWKITLKPGERIPFRIHNNNYSCTSFTNGLLISRNINGRIVLLRLRKGGNMYRECREKKEVVDSENIGEETIILSVVEEKTTTPLKNK